MAIQFYGYWTGQAIAPEMLCDRGEAEKLPTGERVKVSVSRTRSPSHHRALFAALAVVHQSWPDGHRFQTDDHEEFRAWLTIQAGHAVKTRVAIDGDLARARMLEDVYREERRHGNYVWVIPEGGDVIVARPKTIGWSTVDQSEFRMVFDAIARVVMREAGIDIGQVIHDLKEGGRR